MAANAFALADAAADQSLTDQSLTQAELERARLYIEQTKIGILGALRNISEAQWLFKPGDRWSISEIVEHVVVVQERVLGPVWEKLQSSPAAAAHTDHRLIDDIVVYRFPNRLNKFPSPSQPAGGCSRAEAIERLLANYSQLNARLETPGLRNHSLEAPPIKAVSNGAYDCMDAYQWILATAAHTERHTKQALEVMADPGFPM